MKSSHSGVNQSTESTETTWYKMIQHLSQPAYIVGPPSAGQWNTIQITFPWRAIGGPLLDDYWDVMLCHILLSRLNSCQLFISGLDS